MPGSASPRPPISRSSPSARRVVSIAASVPGAGPGHPGPPVRRRPASGQTGQGIGNDIQQDGTARQKTAHASMIGRNTGASSRRQVHAEYARRTGRDRAGPPSIRPESTIPTPMQGTSKSSTCEDPFMLFRDAIGISGSMPASGIPVDSIKGADLRFPVGFAR